MFGEYDYDFNPSKTDELCSMLKYYLNRNMAHIEDLEREVNALRVSSVFRSPSGFNSNIDSNR